jgi:hypothetical protein
MRSLIDAMFPPEVLDYLKAAGHNAESPTSLGDPKMPDKEIVEISTAEGMVIVTENSSDFAMVNMCPVVFALKAWWPAGALAIRLATALDRWAAANSAPGNWPYWLDARFR